MAKYQFLSDEWTEAARALRAEYQDRLADPTQQVKVNLTITDVPFGEGTVESHIDTGNKEEPMGLEHLEGAPLTLTTDYETAKAIFVAQDPQAGMQAFMAGKIKAQGDMTQMMLLQQQQPGEAEKELSQKLNEITE